MICSLKIIENIYELLSDYVGFDRSEARYQFAHCAPDKSSGLSLTSLP